MELALLIVAALVAFSLCPLLMWWQRRRGRPAPCCEPRRLLSSAAPDATAHSVQDRQRALAERLASLKPSESPSPEKARADG